MAQYEFLMKSNCNLFLIKEFEVSDYLRMSGLYCSLTFLDLCNSADRFNRQDIVDFVKRNQRECGGFAPSDGHDPHLLYSLSALQVISDSNNPSLRCSIQ